MALSDAEEERPAAPSERVTDVFSPAWGTISTYSMERYLNDREDYHPQISFRWDPQPPRVSRDSLPDEDEKIRPGTVFSTEDVQVLPSRIYGEQNPGENKPFCVTTGNIRTQPLRSSLRNGNKGSTSATTRQQSALSGRSAARVQKKGFPSSSTVNRYIDPTGGQSLAGPSNDHRQLPVPGNDLASQASVLPTTHTLDTTANPLFAAGLASAADTLNNLEIRSAMEQLLRLHYLDDEEPDWNLFIYDSPIDEEPQEKGKGKQRADAPLPPDMNGSSRKF